MLMLIIWNGGREYLKLNVYFVYFNSLWLAYTKLAPNIINDLYSDRCFSLFLSHPLPLHFTLASPLTMSKL